MWICLNDAFISIVTDEKDPTQLKVRARRRDHLKRLFPRARIHVDDKADYRFRIFTSREEVAGVIAAHVLDIHYPNFKSSVKDRQLHDMYALWWGDHRKLQDRPKAKRSFYYEEPFSKPSSYEDSLVKALKEQPTLDDEAYEKWLLKGN